MPENKQVSEAEAKRLVTWVLSLKYARKTHQIQAKNLQSSAGFFVSWRILTPLNFIESFVMPNHQLTRVSIAAAISLGTLCVSAQETSPSPTAESNGNNLNFPTQVESAAPPAVPVVLQVGSSLDYPDGSKLRSRNTEVKLVQAADMQKSTAGKVALGVLLLAFTGGTGFTINGKETMGGRPIEGVDDRSNLQIPLNAFVGQLQSKVNAAIQAHTEWSGKTFKKTLTVAGGIVNLVYETLTGEESKLYRVKADWVVYKRNESFTLFANPWAMVDCSYQSATPQPLETWAENNYSQVKTELDTQFSLCEQKVLAALPDLLKR